jgi:carbonic anhydrase/acetyltransferase-like protein (isoleucine patch superfamily)
MAGMVGWSGNFTDGKRPKGIHPLALVGAPPEHRDWNVGDRTLIPEISGTALVDAFCTVDAGMPGLRTTRIGNWTWLQKRVHVGHNAWIGNNCEICVGVVVCGEVHIGNGVKIGGNSWIKPLVKIGDGAIIGGGSVVTKDVPAHEVWAGSPARYMKNAWTHPDHVNAARGLEGRERVRAQYDLTPDQWEAARNAVGYPTNRMLDEYRELENGLGAGVGGDAA